MGEQKVEIIKLFEKIPVMTGEIFLINLEFGQANKVLATTDVGHC